MDRQAQINDVLASENIGAAILKIVKSYDDWADSLDAVSTALSVKFGMSTPEKIRSTIERLHDLRDRKFADVADSVFDIARDFLADDSTSGRT